MTHISLTINENVKNGPLGLKFGMNIKIWKLKEVDHVMGPQNDNTLCGVLLKVSESLVSSVIS